jgi:hypothetical protein
MTKFLTSLGVSCALLTLSPAMTNILIRRGDTVSIQFEDEIRLDRAREGDRVEARVLDAPSRWIRNGRLIGEIQEVRSSRRDRAGSVEIEFDQLILDDGRRVEVRAVPTNLARGRSNRDDSRHKSTAVLGGLVGGAAIGALIKKPFEGAFVGALAGILVAETGNGQRSGAVVVRRGQKMSARFLEEIVEDDVRSGREERGWNGSIERDGVRFVSLSDACRRYGFELERINERVWQAENDGTVLRIEQDSENYRLNGRRHRMEKPAIYRDGDLWVPEDLMKKLQGTISSS